MNRRGFLRGFAAMVGAVVASKLPTRSVACSVGRPSRHMLDSFGMEVDLVDHPQCKCVYPGSDCELLVPAETTAIEMLQAESPGSYYWDD